MNTKKNQIIFMHGLMLVIIFLSINFSAVCQRDFSTSEITKLVVLGSGNPNPSPTESGSGLAIIVHDVPYLVDFGPGVIRKFAALTGRYDGIFHDIEVRDIKRAFLTHMHSDHTIGYPDLILTPWVMGRNEPLEVYGPLGLQHMTDHILEAYSADIKYRIYGSEPANDLGWRVRVSEIVNEGVVYKDSLVTVEAFPVIHGTWPNAWGFRFTTPDKVIVISGDTKPVSSIIDYTKNADILVHEVYAQKGFETRTPAWQAYHAAHHTSSIELGEIAAESQPGLVVMYHILYWGASEEDLLDEIKSVYTGNVAVGKDLDIY